MARRKPYTAVERENQVRPTHVRGMGDVVFKGFQCLSPECTAWITAREDEIPEDFEIRCPKCGFVHRSGEVVKFFDFKVQNKTTGKVVEKGEFSILIEDYISEASRYKYCILCCALKPIEFFDNHASRNSGRQGECRLCKALYNSIKNQTRIGDQHREAAQKRRLYVDITGTAKIDSSAIRAKFDNRCYKCPPTSVPLGPREGHLDHTLPVSYLWPLTTNNATLLCDKHNGEKSGKWPSEYYTKTELKRLAVLTGIDYEILAGEPRVNPDALEALKDRQFVDQLLTKYAPYMDEIIKVRNRLLRQSGFDFFAVTTALSMDIVKRANDAL